MHEDCYELLGKVAKPRMIDTAALYQVFTAHLPPPSHGSPNALDFDYGPGEGMLSLSPVSIHDGQATDITESALKKAHKSIVRVIGRPPNVPTGPAAGRGCLEMYRPERANPTELGRTTINGEHERHLEITTWLCMQSTKDISDTVWENKFSTEFAWILEFLPSKEEIERRQVDRFLFCKVINDLGSGRGFDAFKARSYRDILRALHNRRRLWNFFSKIIEEYLPLSKQRSAPKPKAESLPQVSKSTSTPMASTLVPRSTPTAIDFFRRPLKGSKPWP
ncbi:hypothetical protein FOXYS1_10360 [Fusarium oxysporum]|uniref:Uncharacterized protein n=1 Tax=Fusarium oxysporum TaxID=5507 RepID=A0A8H5EFQ7_FUSOX|nr:hypothetical protein FOXYS1_10360 [Fusarium oxysporum]